MTDQPKGRASPLPLCVDCRHHKARTETIIHGGVEGFLWWEKTIPDVTRDTHFCHAPLVDVVDGHNMAPLQCSSRRSVGILWSDCGPAGALFEPAEDKIAAAAMPMFRAEMSAGQQGRSFTFKTVESQTGVRGHLVLDHNPDPMRAIIVTPKHPSELELRVEVVGAVTVITIDRVPQ